MKIVKLILGSILLGMVLMAIAPKVAIVFGLLIATGLAVAALRESFKSLALVGGALAIVWAIWYWNVIDESAKSEIARLTPAPEAQTKTTKQTVVVPARFSASVRHAEHR
jgi:hypothetical protein